MIRPVVGTIFTRVFVQAMNLLVIMLAGHALGAEGLGAISLIVLAITIVVLINNVVGGGALVYLAPRAPLARLLRTAYGWALGTAVLAAGLVFVFPMVPDAYRWAVVGLALIQSFYTIHTSLMIGQQRIGAVNRVQLIQATVLMAVFGWRVLFGTDPTVTDYIIASYAAFGATLLTSGWAILRWKVPPTLPMDRSIKEVLWRQGGSIQLANLLQLLNYRLAYYLIEHFRGVAGLGIYSVGNQLAESAWIAPKSVGTVLYSRISNMEELHRQRDLTLTAFKASVVLAFAVLFVLFLLPEPLYQTLFGADIIGVPLLLLLLAPGILAMAASQAFSHFFSGVGRNKHNAIASGIGLVLTLGAGPVLIPRYGLEGAAVTASLAYIANVLYQTVVFLRSTGSTVLDLLPNASDRSRIQALWERRSDR